jgi:hypothetical protein
MSKVTERYTTIDYLEKNPTWDVEDSPWKAKHILKLMQKNNLTPKSLAEIGCGAGEILHQLYMQMEQDVLFTGYEISQHAFIFCQQREKDRLHYKMNNVFEESSSYFDVVMAIDVVEHVENCFEFLRNLKMKGEYKILHIPLEMSVKCLLTKYHLKSREKYGHIHYFSKDTALALLRDTGYEIIDSFYTSVIIYKEPRSLHSLLLRLGNFVNKNLSVRVLGGHSLMVLAK